MFPIINTRLSRYHTRADHQVEISSDLRNALRNFQFLILHMQLYLDEYIGCATCCVIAIMD